MRIDGLSLRDFAIYICDYLIKNEIDIVLSGGACVSIYTKNRYMSYDLDFVLISHKEQKEIRRLLVAIGFYEEEMFFKHKETKYFLHFVSPPLSIGNEPVIKVHEIKRGSRTLRLLSPTDCVKDRLSAYYHWNDRQSLDQAVMVARKNRVNIAEVRRWSIREQNYEKYRIFYNLFKMET
jgi:hypothetical protein